MSLPQVAADPITKFRIVGISARPAEYVSGVNPVLLPPPDRSLYLIGAIDGYNHILVSWDDEDGDRQEAIIRVEATR